jgi:hypothetical protein
MRAATVLGVITGLALALSPAPSGAEAFGDTAIGGGARALSLGEGGAAAATGAESLFWTPAGIAGSPEPEFLLGHTSWVQDLNNEAGAAVLPLGGLGVVGVSGSWQTLSGIEERDAAGNLVKKLSLTTGNGNLAFAREFGSHASFGVSGGFRIQNGVGINKKAIPVGLGFGADIGEVRLGLSAVGVLAPLPAYQASLAWRLKSGGVGLLLMGGAVLRQDEDRVGAGLEAEVGKVLRLRAGYMAPFQESGLDGFSNLTAGIGLAYRTLSIDYAFLPLGDLGQVHRVQVSLRMLDRAPTGAASAPAPAAAAAAPPTGPTATTAEPAKPKKDVEMEFVVPAKAASAQPAP